METDGGKVSIFHCVFCAFLQTSAGCGKFDVQVPFNVPSSFPAALFHRSFPWRERQLWGMTKKVCVLPGSALERLQPSPSPVSVSLVMNRSPSRIRFDAFASYPVDLRVLDFPVFLSHPFRLFSGTLISRIGIDERGKKGIFPSNYVRSNVPYMACTGNPRLTSLFGPSCF
jgi:hypothetical protein